MPISLVNRLVRVCQSKNHVPIVNNNLALSVASVQVAAATSTSGVIAAATILTSTSLLNSGSPLSSSANDAAFASFDKECIIRRDYWREASSSNAANRNGNGRSRPAVIALLQ